MAGRSLTVVTETLTTDEQQAFVMGGGWMDRYADSQAVGAGVGAFELGDKTG